ncbi:MAG: TetR/AcrR family transcriptional regulator [Chitinophagaceae bacterium]|nr:TetR/AcrR family transcriptional regulator [Chitinophagaceae bacterium]
MVKITQPHIDKREHLINEAIELFAEKGFEGTSIRDLATRAGVNIAMVNYYFGSKEKLFEAIVAKKASHMRGVLDIILANKALTEIEKLDAIIEGYVTRFFAYPTFHRVLQQELLVSSRDHMHETIIELFIRNTKDVVGIIQKGIKSGVFKKVDPELTFASIIGTLNQVLSSAMMCNKLMNKPKDYNPYDNPQFKKRLITHIQCVVHALLLK